MTKNEILKIPVSRPNLIFNGKYDEDKDLYRRLTHEWHPDLEGGDVKVFQHIVALYRERELQIENGTWQGAGLEEYATEGTKGEFLIHYLRQHKFELGTEYICRENIIYVIAAKHRNLYDKAIAATKVLRFVDVRMKDEFQRQLPSIASEVRLFANSALIVHKSPDLIALRDVVSHIGQIPLVHVAWIISRLMGLACYLQYTDIAHGAIDQDTVFIAPQSHTIALLGGWWYANRRGERLSHLPAHSAHVWRNMPHAVQAAKRATSSLDAALIKTLIRELLGDPAGTQLLRNPNIPKPLALFANSSSAHRAVDEFVNWEKAREQSFGVRRFTKWNLRASDIYGR
jgi:hypothetical protein